METTTKRETIVLNVNPKKELKDLLWCLKARSTDKTRLVASYMYVNGDNILCTDGKRVHMIIDRQKLSLTISDGLWEVKISKDSIIFIPIDGMQFPDYKSVLPNYNSNTAINLYFDSKPIDISIAMYKIYQAFNKGLNYELLKDLAGIYWYANSNKDKEGSIIEFKSNNLYALMMEIKTK